MKNLTSFLTVRVKRTFTLVAILFIVGMSSQAANYFPSSTGGNWNAGASWNQTTCNGAACTCIPTTSTDVITIGSCVKTITVTASYASGGALTINGGTLIIQTGVTLTVTSLTMTSGTLTIQGTGALNVTGNVSITGGTFTAGAGTVALLGTTQSITSNQAFFNLTCSGSGVKTMLTDVTVSGLLSLIGSANALTVGAHTLTLNGTVTQTSSGIMTLASTSSLVLGLTTNYADFGVFMSNTGAVAITALTINASATFTSKSFNISGNLVISAGTLKIGSSTANIPWTLNGSANSIAAAGSLNLANTTVTTSPLNLVGTLSNSGQILFVSSSSVIQLNVTGTFNDNASSYTNQNTATQISFASAANYHYQRAGGTGKDPFLASWNANSNFFMDGNVAIGSIPQGNMGQTFGNFIWNTSTGTVTITLSVNLTCAGTFTMQSTNSQTFSLGTKTLSCTTFNMNGSSTTIAKLDVSSGLLSCTGYAQTNGTLSISTGDVTVTGNYTQTVGIVNLGSSTGGYSASGFLNVTGSFTLSTTTTGILTTNGSSFGTIQFNGSSSQAVTFVNAANVTPGSSGKIRILINNPAGITTGGTAATGINFSNNTAGTLEVVNSLGVTSGLVTYPPLNTTALIYSASVAQTTSLIEYPATNPPQNLTFNNTATYPAGVTLGAAISVPTANPSGANVRLARGLVKLAGFDLTLNGSTSTLNEPAGGYSATASATTGMFVADGAGQFKWNVPSFSTSTYLFPVGDVTGTVEYSPVQLDFSVNNATRIVGVRVVDETTTASHVNNTNWNTGNTPPDFLKRHWFLTNSAGSTYTLVGGDGSGSGTYFQYAAGDASGTEDNLRMQYFNSTVWSYVPGTTDINTTNNQLTYPSNSSGTFDLLTGREITGRSFAAPANDLCGGAVTITNGGGSSWATNTTCTSTAGTTVGATLTGFCSICSGDDDDVWYKFVPTTSAARIRVTGTSGFDPYISLADGSCGGTSDMKLRNFTTGNGTEELNVQHLVPGTTYFVRVLSNGVAPAGQGTFNICVYNLGTPGGNDDVLNAIDIPNSSLGVGVVGNNNTNYTSEFRTSGCTGCEANDFSGSGAYTLNQGQNYSTNSTQWFTFTPAVTSTYNVAISMSTAGIVAALGTNTNADPTGQSMTTIVSSSFSSGTSLTFSSACLTAGTKYYIEVDGYFYSHGTPTVTITNTLATPTAIAADPIHCTDFTAKWNTVSGATGYILDVATDANFTNMVAGYDSLPLGNVLLDSVGGLTEGTTYYYRVRDTKTVACGTGTSSSSNVITVTTLPVPTTPVFTGGAIALCVGGTDTYTATSNTTVTYSIVGNVGATIDANSGVVSNVTGNFTVHATADFNNGCGSSSADRAVTVTPVPGTPTVDSPICDGASSVTGISGEADGTTITIYEDGLSSGFTGTVSGGLWAVSLPALSNGVNVQATATAGGCESSLSSIVPVGTCGINLDVNFFLQGYYLGGGNMSPLLHLLGAASTTAVDTVTIELHDSNSPYSSLYSFTGIVQTDGSLACTFPQAADGGTFYLVVKHRNSMETWSAAAQMVGTGGISSYDFTAAGAAYGAGSTANLGGGVYGIYSCDINQDDAIDGSDKYLLQAALSSFSIGVYDVNDITGDGFVDEDDYRITLNNVPLTISVQHP